LAASACALAAAPQRAGAAVPYVDRRVTALPASQLVSADPRTYIDGRRQEIAKTLAWYRRGLFFAWALSQIGAFAYLWRSGHAARLRDALKRRIRSPFWLRFAYGAALAIIAGLAALPASLAQYRVSVVFDQSAQPFWSWLRDGIVRVGFDALGMGIVVAVVLTLVARTRAWWVYATLGMFALSLAIGFFDPVAIAPAFNRSHLLPAASPYAGTLQALEREAGVDAPVYVGDASRQTQIVTTRMLGYGPTARIWLGDTLFASATAGEVAFAFARELAHFKRDDALRTTFVWTLLFVFSIAAGVLVAESIGFRGDDDPLARLALVCALAGCAGLLAFPVYNVYSRHIEEKADAYALSLTHDPASAVRSFVRAADRRFVMLCSPQAAIVYFGPAPALGSRIASATGRPDPCR
jgi:STE24 endopeptidase